MSQNKWTKSEIWAWYLSQKVEKYSCGRSKASKKDDKYNIRIRAVINGDRLIIGFWQGAKGERKGVYYMTPAGGHFASHDGVNWHVEKFEYVILGGYSYYGSVFYYEYKFISGAAEADSWLNQHFKETVKRWSCNAKIQNYIDTIERQILLTRKYNSIKRKKERINNWLSGLPAYPADMNEFVSRTVFGDLHFAFGRKNSDDYSCSVCGGQFKSQKLKHRQFYQCPMCGAVLKCEKMHCDKTLSSRVMLIQSYHDISGNICSVKREIFVWKDFDSSGEKIEYSDGALIVLPLNGELANGDNIYYKTSGEWSDKNTWGFQHSKCYCYPDVSALSGTAYDKRSIEASANKGWYLHYNNLMRSYYNELRMEYLIKGDFYELVRDITSNEYRRNCLMPGSDIQSVLGLDGQGVARLRANNGNVNYLTWLRAGFMCGYKLPEKVLKYFSKKNITPNDVSIQLNLGVSPEKIANYIEKQRKRNGCRTEYVVITWRDTLNMTNAYGLDGCSYTIFPTDLKKRHDELVGIKNTEDQRQSMQFKLDNLDQRVFGKMNKVSEIEQRHPMVKDICESVKPVFEWSDGIYSVLVPNCIQDVLVEGYLLGHCIAKPKNDGTYLYFERIEERESYICFLRKNENIKAPWYTMEVEPNGAIRQLRTFGDDEGADRDEAKTFLKKWRAKVRTRLGNAEIEAAEISKEKRLREFAELRKGQNRIYNGKLKGLLLADVLEADFKEFNSDEFAEAI